MYIILEINVLNESLIPLVASLNFMLSFCPFVQRDRPQTTLLLPYVTSTIVIHFTLSQSYRVYSSSLCHFENGTLSLVQCNKMCFECNSDVQTHRDSFFFPLLFSFCYNIEIPLNFKRIQTFNNDLNR